MAARVTQGSFRRPSLHLRLAPRRMRRSSLKSMHASRGPVVVVVVAVAIAVTVMAVVTAVTEVVVAAAAVGDAVPTARP